MGDRPVHQIKPGTSQSLICFTVKCASQLGCVYFLLLLCICTACGFIIDFLKDKIISIFQIWSVCGPQMILLRGVSFIKNNYQTGQVIVLPKI